MWNLKDIPLIDASVFRRQYEGQWDNSPKLHATSEIDPENTHPWVIFGESKRQTAAVMKVEYGGHWSRDRKWMMLPTGEARIVSRVEELHDLRRVGTLFCLTLNPYRRIPPDMVRAREWAHSRGVVSHFLTPTR